MSEPVTIGLYDLSGCDLCGRKIWDDDPGTLVTGTVMDYPQDRGAIVKGLLACPSCFAEGPGVEIWHARWRIRTVIEPDWALPPEMRST